MPKAEKKMGRSEAKYIFPLIIPSIIHRIIVEEKRMYNYILLKNEKYRQQEIEQLTLTN